MIGYFVPMAVISVLSNLFMGWVSSRTRLKYLLAAVNTGGVVSVLGVIHLDTDMGVALYIVGNGIAAGGFSCLSGIVWPRFYGRRWLGSVSGVSMSSMVIASGIGPLIFGASFALFDAYMPILWFCSLLPALLLIGSSWADNPQRYSGGI